MCGSAPDVWVFSEVAVPVHPPLLTCTCNFSSYSSNNWIFLWWQNRIFACIAMCWKIASSPRSGPNTVVFLAAVINNTNTSWFDTVCFLDLGEKKLTDLTRKADCKQHKHQKGKRQIFVSYFALDYLLVMKKWEYLFFGWWSSRLGSIITE